ncbi:alcohol dehydrogenase [Biscogniauxia mediterranea]|nr:alcohol dehydrogenase [Biscogniauxia mediterranea]
MSKIPTTMRALVAPRYCAPSQFELRDIPVPSITKPKDVLIRVHAAGIQRGDMLRVRGAGRLVPGTPTFPMTMGMEGSGVVAAVGSAVTTVKPGDAVYGYCISSRPMDLFAQVGFAAEYALAPEGLLLPKPAHITHKEAASLLGFLTAFQAIDDGVRMLAENGVVADGLRGKTVFVPGALSATGAAAIQLLKRHYGVGRVVSSASTAKLPLVERYLPGLVDELVDYTSKRSLADLVAPGSVDFVYNTQWGVVGTFALVRPDRGVVVSIASVPPPGLLRQMLHGLPFWVLWIAGLAQWYYAFRLRGTGIRHRFTSGDLGVRADLERAGKFVADGKATSVRREVELGDLEGCRRECEKVASGKGGIGKLVIKIA